MLSLAIAAAFAFSCAPSFTAYEKAPGDMALIRRIVDGDKQLLVSDDLQLTEREAAAFWPVYESFHAELRKLNGRLLDLIEEYAANQDSMTDAAAMKLVHGQLALDPARARLMAAYVPRFAKALPPKKLARYYQIENKIRATVNYDLAAQVPLVR